ncbi:MAG TPA: RNA polymerase sigma-70 factor [Puia sp.]|jgi:RNA polymerase sigma-70 factor (ECF subfamily)|nr:RNA polymerase sigma-70 factor [Puia sp.]
MITAEQIQYLQQRIACHDDQHAYKLLFTALYPYLFPFAQALVKLKEPAEEIVSDVFIKVWEKRKELPKIENLRLYLYVATRHIALNYLDKQKRRPTRPLDGFQHAELISVNLDPEQLLITADMMALLRKAIDQLPPKCKVIFKLVKEDGLKYREVAEVLGISAKTVENQLAIALHKLGSAVDFDIKKALPTPIKSY